jgi:glutamate-1-semialdehyde 2,1-aminomutase
MATRSEILFEEAQRVIPGGVNSPVRAFRQVGGTPVFMKSAKGAYLWDEDGRRYLDYINSWGPMVLGHGHPSVITALVDQAQRAVSFGAPTELEVRMAELVLRMVPGLDLIRFVNSGTEACMSAIRVARGFTGRSKIIKFEGHYHGHADSFLKKAGSGVATLGIKVNAGVPDVVAADTLVATFNDHAGIEELVQQQGADTAALIVEPVAGNMGCVPPAPGFLRHLRELCDQHGIVLIFDEVMTGFRLAPGGAQELFDIQADLVTLGKIIGGGLPVGAFGGKKQFMNKVAPLGEVYQAGTLSGNPLAMTAGYATLSVLDQNPHLYRSLEEKTKRLARGIEAALANKDFPVVVNQVGSMISVHFCQEAVVDFRTAGAGNNDTFKRFFHHMLAREIYLPPSPFESWFVSDAVTAENIEYTIASAADFNG